MSIGLVMKFNGVDAEQYEAVMSKDNLDLRSPKNGQAADQWPDGAVSHVAGTTATSSRSHVCRTPSTHQSRIFWSTTLSPRGTVARGKHSLHSVTRVAMRTPSRSPRWCRHVQQSTTTVYR